MNQASTRPRNATLLRLLMGSLLASLALSLSVGTTAASAQTQAESDLRAGAYLAANCANCHGTSGNATSSLPGLAGMPAEGFIATMIGYREGKRNPTIMHQLAKGYTDRQIALMAQYFARQSSK